MKLVQEQQPHWNPGEVSTRVLWPFASVSASLLQNFLADWSLAARPPLAACFPSRAPTYYGLSRTHNEPLIGAHMFSQRASVTKPPRRGPRVDLWSRYLNEEDLLAGALVQSARSVRGVETHWRLEALWLGAQKPSESTDRAHLQRCWVL